MTRGIDWSALHTPSHSLTDSLSLALERLILAGDLADGDRLPPERELALQMGVSRSSLRDALRALELRGLIERKQGRGTVVRDSSRSPEGDVLASGLDLHGDDFAQAIDVRACIEPPIAARAAARVTPLDVAQLERLLDDMSRDIDQEEFRRLDRLFHRAIAQYTHNPLLLRLLDRVSEVIEVTRRTLPVTRATRRRAIVEHRAIVTAIAAHDSDAAYEAAAQHIAGMLTETDSPESGAAPDSARSGRDSS